MILWPINWRLHSWCCKKPPLKDKSSEDEDGGSDESNEKSSDDSEDITNETHSPKAKKARVESPVIADNGAIPQLSNNLVNNLVPSFNFDDDKNGGQDDSFVANFDIGTCISSVSNKGLEDQTNETHHPKAKMTRVVSPVIADKVAIPQVSNNLANNLVPSADFENENYGDSFVANFNMGY